MLNLDPSKLLIIAVVAIILLGPDRLPAFARQVGGAWRSFTAYRHRLEAEIRSSMPDLPSTAEIARLARSPHALLDHLSTMSSDADGTMATAGATLRETQGESTAETIVVDVTPRDMVSGLAAPVRVPRVAPVSAVDPGLN
jgi:Sec-independent protein translocase protein TatA